MAGPVSWVAPTAGTPVRAEVRLPGSKSMTARALVLSALAAGPSTLRYPLRARDTELMAAGLAGMGAGVDSGDDRLWAVRPGPLAGPAHVDVGLSGTVMRFVPPVAGLADGPVSFDGDPRARQRPLGPIVEALRALGVRIDSAPSGGLPLTVHGAGGVTGGEVTIDASASSQFVSGLLLAAAAFDKGIVVRHVGPPVPSAPHLRMTARMLRAAGATVDDATPDVWTVEPGALAGRDWDIEPDLSGAVPFLAAALVTGGRVTVPGLPRESLQPGDRLCELLTAMGGECVLTDKGLTVTGTGVVHGLNADLSDVSELTPTIAALAALADSPSRLTGVEHIRGHETDRIAALARELIALGADVTELRDGLEVRPARLHGGEFETYQDHRMAHAAAVVGLAVPDVRLSDVSCTSKTMPEFPELWASIVEGTH
ncbi:3-phosphoshikimate 1-carboxyvinyltransferase [Rugosimonospora africana]|uniref:3-phosphoshikimate 1-carboxyvinyltransferase n=1 Tax=Rugosimonospora africana TaxID=556532 RepID=A0A8J3QMP7_9ACTN|nr:3-phosphoshikimate 1-carboxyvinyltransferase [Rugosimonospora africana]GIH12754.1 3-phosphoshikimate 1-carboxyvinyltransferase 1 [Rugosimonospora africana]